MTEDQQSRAINYCLNWIANNGAGLTVVNGIVSYPTNSQQNFGSTITIGGDVYLVREAANTLAQRNSTVAQTHNIYGTYTDASNYRRLRIAVSATGVVTFFAEGLGTGLTTNSMVFSSNGSTFMSVSTASTNVTFAGAVILPSAGTLRWGGSSSRLSAPTDGVLNLTTSASGAGTAIQFGGTQIIGARNTGWTAQTAVASKADLGASPTVGALASWARAIQDALVTHGLLGA